MRWARGRQKRTQGAVAAKITLRKRLLLCVTLTALLTVVMFADTGYRVTEPGRAVTPEPAEGPVEGVSILTVRQTPVGVGEYLLRGLQPTGEALTPRKVDTEVDLADGGGSIEKADFQFLSSQWDGWNSAHVLLEQRQHRELAVRSYQGWASFSNDATPQTQSLMVTYVSVASPAADRLYPGDRILEVNGVDVEIPAVQVLYPEETAGPGLTVDLEQISSDTWVLHPSIPEGRVIRSKVSVSATDSYTFSVADVVDVKSREVGTLHSEDFSDDVVDFSYFAKGADCCEPVYLTTSSGPSEERFDELISSVESPSVTVTVERLGHTLEVHLELDTRLSTDGLGVSVGAVGDWGVPEFWSDQISNIQGPSAGLSLALWYLDKIDPTQSLFSGTSVAATGRVLPNGVIHSIGGVEEKMELVAATGTFDVIFVPAANYTQAQEYTDELAISAELVPVRDVKDALVWLCENGSAGACGFSEETD